MNPDQARRLRESATNIIAHEKQLEGKRKKLYDELERLNTNARQAVMMAEEATQSGDDAGAARFNESAGIIAEEIVRIDTQIAAIDVELIEARQASEEAKSIASDSAIQTRQMQARGAELRAEFEQAKMAEASLEATGSPSFDEVKAKIGDRVARAEAEAELAGVDEQSDLDGATALVEQASADARAAAKLAEIRSSMGLMSAGSATEADPQDAPVDQAPDGSADDDPPATE